MRGQGCPHEAVTGPQGKCGRTRRRGGHNKLIHLQRLCLLLALPLCASKQGGACPLHVLGSTDTVAPQPPPAALHTAPDASSCAALDAARCAQPQSCCIVGQLRVQCYDFPPCFIAADADAAAGAAAGTPNNNTVAAPAPLGTAAAAALAAPDESPSGGSQEASSAARLVSSSIRRITVRSRHTSPRKQLVPGVAKPPPPRRTR